MWRIVVDTAEIITAVMAIAGVITAVWLGKRSTEIARSDNHQEVRPFLYS